MSDITLSGRGYVRQEMATAQPPPAATTGAVGWMRANLFSSPLNAILTLAAFAVVLALVPPVLKFLFVDAVWTGRSRDACLATGTGACWPFVWAKINQFMYGFYQAEERWRVNLVFVVFALLVVGMLWPRVPYKLANAVLLFVAFPVFAYVFLVGGVFGMPHVETARWGGFLVSMVVAVTGIVFSLPLGILLALGRRSKLPMIKMLSVIFIEFWRGVPLITVLFMAKTMMPFFMPAGVNLDDLLSVLIGVALFSAAYMAEVVRGGLQAIPKGQYEGAMALGLGYGQMTGLIVLPQALKLVIPGIVNTFIGLFKDTTLVSIVGILDLLGQIRAGFADPSWATPVTLFTGFAFAGIIYFFFCFGMSRYSIYVEQKLHTGHKRR